MDADELTTEGAATVDEPVELSGSERWAENDDLRESLSRLSQLGTRELGLNQLLTRVAAYAVRAIPGADGAGLMVSEDDRPDTIVATDPFVAEIDTIQYSIGQGPCVLAAATGRTVRSGALSEDARWRRFGGRVASLGVNSVLSLPLVTSLGVVGAMNVYAHDHEVFDQRAAELGEQFAVPAAISVANAHVLSQTQRLTVRLKSALETRAVIDRAVGIMLSRSGGTETEAMNRLRALSRNDHRKLVEIATGIVDEAVRRAQTRHPPGDPRP